MLTALTLPYADTSAAALHWSAEQPAAPPLDTLQIRAGAVTLTLHLLGASHAATLQHGDSELVETVACPAHGAPGEPLPAERDRVVDGLRYRFTSDVERLDAPGLRDLARQLRAHADGRDDHLAGIFPGARDALTVLAGAATADGASWRTWHLYPNTGEVVRTATRVTW